MAERPSVSRPEVAPDSHLTPKPAAPNEAHGREPDLHPPADQPPSTTPLATQSFLAPLTTETTVEEPSPIGHEVDDHTDVDSSFGDDSASSFLSLIAEAKEYVFENGRRYHGYKSGRYMLPNDENEMDREDVKHHISMLITEGRLHLAPIGPHPQKILDIGTGTGIWAIEIADAYPSAEVIATDLSAIQPSWIPPNLYFEIDDAEDEWLWNPQSADLVHVRYLFHGIRDWPKLLRQSLKVLKPGGWLEFVEFYVIPTSYDDSLPEDSHIMRLYTVLADIGKRIGIDLDIAEKFKSMMEAAGFEDVQEKVFDLPMGDWPKDPRMKEIGIFEQWQMMEGLQGIATGLLSRVAKWSPHEIETFLVGIRREMKDRSVHSLYKLYFVYGRSPPGPGAP